jgi:hypothetical protein
MKSMRFEARFEGAKSRNGLDYKPCYSKIIKFLLAYQGAKMLPGWGQKYWIFMVSG